MQFLTAHDELGEQLRMTPAVPSRTGNMHELIGASCTWQATRHFSYSGPSVFNRPFAESLLASLLAGEVTPSDTRHYSDFSKRFLEVPEEYADSIYATYGPKLAKGLPKVIAELASNTGSRRAYLPILCDADSPIRTKPELSHLEYPCTVGYLFAIRDESLSMVTFMRSQHWGRLHVLDSFIQNELLCHVCNQMGSDLKLGTITQLFGSIHTNAK